MITPEKCQILKKIKYLQSKGQKIPQQLLCQLAQCDYYDSGVIGPYLKIISTLLYPPNGQPLFPNFSLNIQYYNQANYYTTYEHLFTDLNNGPYQMTQSSTVKAIQGYFQSQYNGNVPQLVKDSIVIGKLLVPAAGVSDYVDLNTLASWMKQAQPTIPFGGYMFWSAGFYTKDYPSNQLVTNTFANIQAKHKVMYIGAGDSGQVYTAEGEPVYAFASDPDGAQARKVLTSYVNAGFNELLLAFWNKSGNSDWVTDWSTIDKTVQKQIISDLKSINPDAKVLVSAGGAYGNVGPQAGDPVDWATQLVNFTKDNNLNGIDLDLEGGLLGTQWSEDQLSWVTTVVQTIAKLDNTLMLSFAPVGPLCANPNPPLQKKKKC